MIAQRQLRIDVGADVTKAMSGLNTLSRQVAGFGRQVQGIRNIAIAVTGTIAVRRAVSGLYDLAKASQNEVAGQARLQRAIANTGRVVDTELIGSLEEWIEAQERATGFADDEQRAALSFLVAQTGDLAEAQRRAALAADLAVGFDMDLVTASKMLGKVTDETVGSLKKLGIALPDAGAGYTDLMADSDTAAELAQKAGISFEGAMKLVKSGGAAGASVLKRYGVAMRQAAGGAAVSAEDVMTAVEKAVGGQARDRMAALGPGAQLANDWNNLKEQVGAFLVPIFAKGAAFALKGIRGLRRVVSLFTTDLSGPKIGSARKIWKAVFGEEMPKALGAVVDSFGKIAARITTFVEELNSTDDNTVRGAVKKLFGGLKDDVAVGLEKLKTEFGKLDLVPKFVVSGLALSMLPVVGSTFLPLMLDALRLGVQVAQFAAVGGGIGATLGLGITLPILSLLVGGGTGLGPDLESGISSVLGVIAAGQGYQLVRGFAGTKYGFAAAAGISLGFTALEAKKALDKLKTTGLESSDFARLILAAAPAGIAVAAGIGGAPLVVTVGALLAISWLGLEFGTPPTNPGNVFPNPGARTPSEIGRVGAGGARPPVIPRAPIVPQPVNPGRERGAGGSDRLATLDDIYAAFTRNHGYMPDFEWAKGILSMGPMWSEIQNLATSSVACAPCAAVIERVDEVERPNRGIVEIVSDLVSCLGGKGPGAVLAG